jgi:hypothetical protein
LLKPKGWFSIFFARARICFCVPIIKTSLDSKAQETLPRATAASPPTESISCLMMLATLHGCLLSRMLALTVFWVMAAIP